MGPSHLFPRMYSVEAPPPFLLPSANAQLMALKPEGWGKGRLENALLVQAPARKWESGGGGTTCANSFSAHLNLCMNARKRLPERRSRVWSLNRPKPRWLIVCVAGGALRRRLRPTVTEAPGRRAAFPFIHRLRLPPVPETARQDGRSEPRTARIFSSVQGRRQWLDGFVRSSDAASGRGRRNGLGLGRLAAAHEPFPRDRNVVVVVVRPGAGSVATDKGVPLAETGGKCHVSAAGCVMFRPGRALWLAPAAPEVCTALVLGLGLCVGSRWFLAGPESLAGRPWAARPGHPVFGLCGRNSVCRSRAPKYAAHGAGSCGPAGSRSRLLVFLLTWRYYRVALCQQLPG